MHRSASGPTAALIAIAVSAATIGTGAAASVGSFMASSVGCAATGAVSTMMAAGFTSVCTSAVMALANNEGDISKAAKAFASDSTLKSAGMAMMAAGVTYGLLKQFDLPTAVTDLNTLGDHAVNQTVHTAARTVAEVTLTGRTDLKGASIGVIAGTLGSYFASNIGMMHAHGLGDAEANLVHKTLHALNGAGQGLIMGVGKGILSQKGVTAEVLGEAVALAAAGALGSLVAETVADFVTPTGGIAHKPESARPSTERIIATQAAARIVAGAVAMAAGMSPDQIQTAIFTATTAVENNCAKSATQAGQGKTKQTDDNGYDTNDEAEQSFVGKGRRAVLKAIGLEKVGQIIDDFRQKLGVDRTLAPIAAYPTDISVGEYAYIDACLDWTRDHVYERPMTTDETQVYRSVCKHAYMKMRENGAGQGPFSAAAAIATMIGNGVEVVLRYTGMTDKGNARAIGQSINDGLAIYGLASIGKVGVQGLARQAKGLGKSAGATEGAAAKLHPDWHEAPMPRGEAIEQVRGQNLPQTFKTIDRFDWETGTATSIKSRDLNAKTYLDPKRLESIIKRDIDALARFEGDKLGDTVIRQHQIKERVLDIAIPHQGNTVQQEIFKRMREYAQSQGIKLSVGIH